MSSRPIMTAGEIREAPLPRSLRGFDESATRKFLNAVADTVQTLTAERDRLRRQVAEAPATSNPEDPTAIGNALLAAQRAGEEIVSHARETAERITTDAREERQRLLEQAQHATGERERQLAERHQELEQARIQLRSERTESKTMIEAERQAAIAEARARADELTAHSQQRLQTLRLEEEALRKLIGERRSRFVDMLQAALDEVGRLHESVADTHIGHPELAEVLASRAGDARDDPATGEDQPPEPPAHGLRLTSPEETTLGKPSDEAPAPPA